MEIIPFVEPQTKTITKNIVQPKDLYSLCSTDVFSMYSWLIKDSQIKKVFLLFSHKLLSKFQNSYEKYNKLFLFKLAVQTLKENQTHYKPLLGLTLDESLVITLKDGLGLQNHEIASILDISLGSVETRLSKLRWKLVSQLQEVDTSSENFISLLELSASVDTAAEPKDSNSSFLPLLRKTKPIVQETLRSRNIPFPQDFLEIPVNPLIAKSGGKTSINWASAPWYIKVLIEGVIATTIVMGIVFSIPKIKNFYEIWQEKSVDFSTLAELASSIGHDTSINNDTVGPQPAGESTEAVAQNQETQKTTTVSSEFSEKDLSKASSNKVYRIIIKTESPETLMQTVQNELNRIEATSSNNAPAVGLVLPGGIMFDAFVPLKNYKQLLQMLTRLGDTKLIITQSHGAMIPGKAKVKVWLQRY